MARLFEYQGKQLIRENGVLTPKGEVASTSEEARKIAEELGCPVVAKVQVWAAGRMKSGGIKFADTPEEAEKAASILLDSEIKGTKITKVLVEEKLDIESEYYAGIIIDESYKIKAPVIIFSTRGGIDIEEVAKEYPEQVVRSPVNILKGINAENVLELMSPLYVQEEVKEQIVKSILGLYNTFRKYGASSAEINPLVLTKDIRIVAADCRISIDDSSVLLHPELGIEVARESERQPTELDKIAWKVEEKDYRGVFYFMQLAPETKERKYVGFHGIGGGASVLMADALVRAGFQLASFADTSGNPTASKVYRCTKIILSHPGVEGYLLGGACIASQEQWYHAYGLVKALREELADKPGFPVIIVIAGNKEEESIRILKEGLKDLPIKLEIYGHDYIDKDDYLAERMKLLVEEYRKNRGDYVE